MMRWPLILIAGIFLLSCANDQHRVKTPAQVAKEQAAKAEAKAQAQRQVTAREKPEEVGPIGYRISGKNARGESCSTGTRNFASRSQMCVGLQDPVLNSDCAQSERVSQFERDCRPDFRFNESLSCSFAIFSGPAAFSASGDIDPRTAIQYGEYCAGRTHGGMNTPGTSIREGHLVDDLYMNMSISFVPAPQTDGAKRSAFQMSIYRKDGQGGKVPVMDEFQYFSGTRLQKESLRGSRFSYAVRCENTWGCGK